MSKTKEEVTAAVSHAYNVLAKSFGDDPDVEYLIIARSRPNGDVGAAVHPKCTFKLVFCLIDIFHAAAQKPIAFRNALREACLRLYSGETLATDMKAFVENTRTGKREPFDLKGGRS